jgi:hypothetical protein
MLFWIRFHSPNKIRNLFEGTVLIGTVIGRYISLVGTVPVPALCRYGNAYRKVKSNITDCQVRKPTVCYLQCCGTGTGTVGAVTFCRVEPEP